VAQRAAGDLTWLRLLHLCGLRQEELGRGLEGVTRHQDQLLELQQLLDVLHTHTHTHTHTFPPTAQRNQSTGACCSGGSYLGRELDWLRQGQLRWRRDLDGLFLFDVLLLGLSLVLVLVLLLLVGLLLGGGVGGVRRVRCVRRVGLLNGGRQELSLGLLEEQLLLGREEGGELWGGGGGGAGGRGGGHRVQIN